MLLKYFIILIVFLLLINSCGLVNSKEEKPDAKITVGSIFVDSNIPGARIFVDSNSKDKKTPDIVDNIPLGSRVVQVYKDGYLINPQSITIFVDSVTIKTAYFSLDSITNQGKLFFDSTPDGAEILVNRVFVGKFTPDTIIVAADTAYNFGLYKHGFDSLEIGNHEIVTNTHTLFDETLIVQKQVLIESFANSSCLPCTTTNTHLEFFVASHNPKQYTLIEYFTSWPNLLDPMFQHNPGGSSARFDNTFYNVTSVPAMFVAGNTVDPSNYTSIVTAFDNQLSNASDDVSISLSQQISDSLRVDVELNEFTALPAGDWRLFIAVIEKEIVFASPPGRNGLSKFSHVFRRFLTSNVGDMFTFSNNKFEKKYASSISSEWDIDEIQIVGFIQNINTKEVIHSTHLNVSM